MSLTTIQKKAGNQFGWVVGCSAFVLLLFINLLLVGIPSPYILLYMLLGSVVLGVLGYYMGIIVASPINIKINRKRKKAKSIPSSFEEFNDEEASASKANTDNSDDGLRLEEPSAQYEQIQNSIPTQQNAVSEHDWVDTAKTSDNNLENEGKTKAFEA